MQACSQHGRIFTRRAKRDASCTVLHGRYLFHGGLNVNMPLLHDEVEGQKLAPAWRGPAGPSLAA